MQDLVPLDDFGNLLNYIPNPIGQHYQNVFDILLGNYGYTNGKRSVMPYGPNTILSPGYKKFRPNGPIPPLEDIKPALEQKLKEEISQTITQTKKKKRRNNAYNKNRSDWYRGRRQQRMSSLWKVPARKGYKKYVI